MHRLLKKKWNKEACGYARDVVKRLDAESESGPIEPVAFHCDGWIVGYFIEDDYSGTQQFSDAIAAVPELIVCLKNIVESVSVRIDDPRIAHFDAARELLRRLNVEVKSGDGYPHPDV